MPEAGAVVAYWSGGTLAFAVVGGEEKQRIRLVLPGGHEERVQAARILHVVEPPGTPPGRTFESMRDAGRRAAAAGERVRRTAEQIEVGLLWELACESTRPLSQEELTELALGSASGESRAALSLALHADGVHFVRKGDGWEPRPAETVEEILRGRERTARRQREREEVFATLSRLVAGEPVALPETDEARGYLRALEEVAIHADDAPETARALAREALAASGQRFDRVDEGCFRLLRRAGRFSSDDENVQVLRYGLRTSFPEEVLEAARAAATRGFARDGREDLTELPLVTIDSARTREIDDGLSIEELPGGGVRLGIHVADPAAFVSPGDPVDVEALARVTTHYLPDMRLTMLPADLSETAASLSEGAERPALSFFVELGPSGERAGESILRSVVRSRARLDYDAADRLISSGEGGHAPMLRRLVDALTALERQRLEGGGVRFVAPEVDVHVEADGRIVLERPDPRSPSRALVGEAMVTAGGMAARFCAARRLPAIYRRQPKPSGALPVQGGAVADDPVAIRALRRVMRRGEVSVHPGAHFGLGLAAYAQATSPLRRFQDLATHRQIAAALAGEPAPYDLESLQRIAAMTERADAEGRRAERACDLYWLLRWLEPKAGGAVEAVVVELEPVPLVQLAETLIEERVPGLGPVALGDRVHLRIERVNPRAELIVLRPA